MAIDGDKISVMTELTDGNVAIDDVVPIVDTSAGATKKVKVSSLRTLIQSILTTPVVSGAMSVAGLLTTAAITASGNISAPTVTATVDFFLAFTGGVNFFITGLGGTLAKMGTSSAHALWFYTNNTIAGYIDADGTLNWTHKIKATAVTSSSASLNIAPGNVDPTVPVAGDVWMRNDGLYVKTVVSGILGPLGPTGTVAEAFKVGGIYMNVTGTNPASELGYGTWTAFGAGRFIVGYSAGDPDFGTVLGTGGEKTHALITTEIPAHNHAVTLDVKVNDPGHLHGEPSVPSSYPHTAANGADQGIADFGSPVNTDTSTTGITLTDGGGTNPPSASASNTGGGGAHNNLPPFIVAYLWRRTV